MRNTGTYVLILIWIHGSNKVDGPSRIFYEGGPLRIINLRRISIQILTMSAVVKHRRKVYRKRHMSKIRPSDSLQKARYARYSSHIAQSSIRKTANPASKADPSNVASLARPKYSHGDYFILGSTKAKTRTCQVFTTHPPPTHSSIEENAKVTSIGTSFGDYDDEAFR